ncbi:MAG: hypothetical protein EZS28_044834 [Streblomastix strix]|uniref:Uncharacterized protein n=1 Tax=Streblomastix strix TaxID=222440 RepID=A0A5J4TNS8_9EUKA|nr:MAG: hypothetical protein EZS28_044834 [Streblomastix strix]
MAVLSDHVNRDQLFVTNWEDGPDKCDMIPSFFQLWETIWKDWLHPSPFSKHPDPSPLFADSAFCIEQYALGQTIVRYFNV